tara:strand:- start:42 stop:527 length:486 start_codon:yes stop_codon:yes gene_type:complete
MSEEKPYMRNKMRICELCEGNLLIQEIIQRRTARGRDENGERIKKYTPGSTIWWCPSCERNVKSKLIDGWIGHTYPYDEETDSMIEDSDYFEMSRPFPSCASLGVCVRGKQEFTLERELQFSEVKSPFLTKLAEEIRRLKLHIAQRQETEYQRILRKYADD